jgi:hypothetical protein
MKKDMYRHAALVAMLFLAACGPADDSAKQTSQPPSAQLAEAPLPKLVSENGRHALLVDGAPFLMLGACESGRSRR